ncbi:hypothetical protein EDC01DRAFT_782510 [Geopyxis carbonaria]|nr:hypothetical protein EDC01DRAFT_782510 [Geopyxis carbonaria]
MSSRSSRSSSSADPPPTLLTLTPIAPTLLPSPTDSAATQAAFFKSLLASAAALHSTLSPPLWRPARTFRPSAPTTGPIPEIATFRTKRGDTHWVARRSHHTSPPFSVFAAGLLHNHARQEVEYVPSVEHVQALVEYDAALAGVEAGVYEVTHRMPWPLWKRVFRVLVVAGEGYCVSVPVKAEEVKGRVRGVYVAVEKVIEGEGGVVEWTVATAAEAGGWIPAWVQRLVMPGTVAKDVGAFLEWAGGSKKAV